MNIFVKHSELQEQDQKRRAENIHFSILKYKRVLRALLHLVLQARDTEEASEAARSPRERVQAVAEGPGKAAGKMARVELGGTDVSADSLLQNLGSTCWRRRTTL